MKTAKHLLVAVMALASLFIFDSCTKDENDSPMNPSVPTVVKHWDVPLSTAFEIPEPTGRIETGTASLDLMSDNTLRYAIDVTGLAAGDSLKSAHLHTGDVVTNGPVILDLMPTFVIGSATDTVIAIRQSLADSLQNSPVYLNVHSSLFPDGLVRGQLDKTIEFASNINLNGSNVVPQVSTSANGLAVLRLTSDKTLYSSINVENLDAADSLTLAGLYLGAVGATGGLFQQLAAGSADFGTTKMYTLSDELITQLKNDPMYLNVHSALQTNGLIRGQLR